MKSVKKAGAVLSVVGAAGVLAYLLSQPPDLSEKSEEQASSTIPNVQPPQSPEAVLSPANLAKVQELVQKKIQAGDVVSVERLAEIPPEEVPEEYKNFPPDLVRQLMSPAPELPEDFKRQLKAPPKPIPEEMRAQLKARPAELPEEVKQQLGVEIKELPVEFQEALQKPLKATERPTEEP